ncbi:arsenate reductase (glutaredoxin) [Primorskyibacter marinus]|uniref:arsenate reductase (glutaredoxin) n=1 Tax=Primorskyibacter marinus TaxID=1977320 RepID=UPI000E307017|nr:arsenate reductase (glutaredoxin) [Primorskyibacter marinus]
MEYWHNPRCSKSRQGLALLEENGVALTVRRYLDDPPSLSELKAVHAALGLPVLAMARSNDPLFAELGLTKDSDDDALLAAMEAHPKLIERPVLIAGDRAVIGRPTEKLLTLT